MEICFFKIVPIAKLQKSDITRKNLQKIFLKTDIKH